MTIAEITLKLAALLNRANDVPAHYSSRYAQGVVNGEGVQVWMLNGGYQVWVLRITGSKPLTISEAAEVIAQA